MKFNIFKSKIRIRTEMNEAHLGVRRVKHIWMSKEWSTSGCQKSEAHLDATHYCFRWIFKFLLDFCPDQSSFSRKLFDFHEFVYFLSFLLFFIFSFNLWWSDRMQGVTLIFLYWLGLSLCLTMLSVLKKVPWAAEKKAYSLVFGSCSIDIHLISGII